MRLRDIGERSWVLRDLCEYADHSRTFRFIYADQRQADGSFSGGALDGPAHGAFFSQLAASDAENVPWDATFVKDKGYVKF